MSSRATAPCCTPCNWSAITGNYGRRLRAAVIGFGATARGAVTALNAHGVDDVRVLTNRDVAAVGSPIHSTQIIQMGRDEATPERTWANTPDDGVIPVARLLADNDIVVNCVLQDPDAPLIFVTEEDLASFTPGSLIVDVSCDTGMGFDWARPTSFTEPIIEMANGVHYYAVDHSPSYLWNSATWEISEALLPHIDTVLAGPAAWDADSTIARAIEIRDGVVLNPGILSFQHRDDAYPHASAQRSTPAIDEGLYLAAGSAMSRCARRRYAPATTGHAMSGANPRASAAIEPARRGCVSMFRNAVTNASGSLWSTKMPAPLRRTSTACGKAVATTGRPAAMASASAPEVT